MTTMRSPGAPLLSFLEHHLHMGFERVFIFHEGPADEALERARQYERVTLIASDDALRYEWQHLPSFSAVGRFVGSEVMARQILNAEVAIRRALDAGIEWLFHIDSDELVFLPNSNLDEHLGRAAGRGATQIVYFNHEAVPEREEIGDFFREVTLFKQNPNTGGSARADLFVAYVTGKAAVRLRCGVRPHGVHRFRVPDASPRTLASRDGCILHYPSCGYTRFAEKYHALGPFVPHWFGQVYIPDAMSFHWEARELITAGRLADARQLYRERVMLERFDDSSRKRLLESGALLRITRLSEWFAARRVAGAEGLGA